MSVSLVFMDGFDYLTVGNATEKWDQIQETASLVTGSYGMQGVFFGGGSGGGVIGKTWPSNFVNGFHGFHYFYPVGPTNDSPICLFVETATTQVDIRIDSLGQIYATRNGTLLGSHSTTRLVVGQLYWFEVYVVIDGSAGIVIVQCSGMGLSPGTVLLNLTSQNTAATANLYFNVTNLRPAGNSSWHDNFHFWTGTSSDFIGEHIIDTKLPNGAGSNAAWTPSGGGSNFAKVNEANNDGDTTYVSSATPNQIDSYAFANLSESAGSILAVAVNTIDRIDDATPRTMEHFVKSSSATALGASISPGASFKNHQSIFQTDPNTSAAWTVSGRNAAEFGMKEIS